MGASRGRKVRTGIIAAMVASLGGSAIFFVLVKAASYLIPAAARSEAAELPVPGPWQVFASADGWKAILVLLGISVVVGAVSSNGNAHDTATRTSDSGHLARVRHGEGRNDREMVQTVRVRTKTRTPPMSMNPGWQQLPAERDDLPADPDPNLQRVIVPPDHDINHWR